MGDLTGGRVGLFLSTDDFDRDFGRMQAAGVRFAEAPRHEAYGTVAVVEDLHGTGGPSSSRAQPSSGRRPG